MVAVPVLVATVVAVVADVVVLVCLRLRDDAPAAQAPVQTAMTTMVTQIPMQQSGTTTAMTIPAITAPARTLPPMVPVKSAM